MKKQKRKLFILSIIFFLACINFVKQYEFDFALTAFIFSTLYNPHIWEKIFERFGIKTTHYLDFLKLQSFCANFLIIIFIISSIVIFFDKELINFSAINNEVVSILKIFYYFIYLFILYMCKSEYKTLKYFIFGVYYFICVILSFASPLISEQIIRILNYIPNINLDFVTYDLIVNTCLISIKEAILTYIIFDTVIENKHKELQTSTNILNEDINNDLVIEENKNDVGISTLKDQFYNVDVKENSVNKSMNYKIHIYKYTSHQ